MADLPNTPITVVPAPSPADPEFPTLGSITVADLVGPVAANRQPDQVETRTDTLRDRVNLMIADLIFIETGGPGALNAFLPRDGGQAMAAALDMGTNLINNVVDPSAPADAATKNYVDTTLTVGIEGYRGEIKLLTDRATPATSIDVEFCRVLDSTNTAMISPLPNLIIDATAVNGALAVDTGGTIIGKAANWYHIYAIRDAPSAGNPDTYIMSLALPVSFGGAGPALPATYDQSRYIGSARWDGAAFKSFRQIDNEVYYEQEEQVASGAPGGLTLVSAAAFIPPTSERGIFGMFMQQLLNGIADTFSFGDAGQVGAPVTTVRFRATSNANMAYSSQDFKLHTSATQSIYWAKTANMNGSELYCRGFVLDNLEG